MPCVPCFHGAWLGDDKYACFDSRCRTDGSCAHWVDESVGGHVRIGAIPDFPALAVRRVCRSHLRRGRAALAAAAK
eukprot:6193468-Pleurochrysis_carterae.AAC.1